MNYVFIDHSTGMYIIKYEKIHAELVTSTYIPKYLQLINHLVEHPLMLGIFESRKLNVSWRWGNTYSLSIMT